ncbi:MAG: hypothetical protein KKC46_09910 [Proteobacteria bacterium]|nr:hypothetical protein [Pseudomonadota bacterium]
MKTKIFSCGWLVLYLFVSIFSVSSFAEEIQGGTGQPSSTEKGTVINQSDINELNAVSDPKSVRAASDNMEDWFETVPHQFNFTSYGENNGKFVLYASQSVSLKPTDPQYGDALVNAFDKAMMKLQEKYLMIRFGKTTTEKIKSFYSDRSTYSKDIPLPCATEPDYLKNILSIFEKGLAVADKKLDQELVELGVAPQEVAKMTPKQKKDIFRDKFIKYTLRNASGSIAGLFPIQTNVITDSTGQTVVGVVAIASPITIQIAKDITLQRRSLISGKGRDIALLLPNTEEEFLGTLGVRLAYDQDGTPVIISYGIASHRPDTGNDYINDELKEESKAEAISSADAQIAEIINGFMNAKNERKRGEEIRTFIEREMKPDSDTVEKTINDIIKITNNKSKSSAQTKLQGISTIKTWRHTVKSGQKFVGAVRVWKYSTIAAVNSFNNPKRTPISQPAEEGEAIFQPTQHPSTPVNTLDDF